MSLVATRLQNWRVKNPALDRNEDRPCEYGALQFFIQQANAANSIVNPELKEKAFQSIGTDVQVPVIKYDENVTVSASRSCTIADDENESALVTLQWVTLQVGFTMLPGLYHNNEIDYQRDFNRKMDKVTRKLLADLDGKAVSALETNKTQVIKDKLNYTFAAQTLDVPSAMETEILGDINPMMRSNCFPGQIHVIGNAGLESLVRKLAQHGLYNDVNKQLEYDDKVFHFDYSIANAGMKGATFYAVEDGNVAVLTRVDRAALAGRKANDHEWGVTRIPQLDLPIGYHYYTSVGDYHEMGGAATTDMVCDVKEHFGFSLDVCFLTAYNSKPASLANPIIKVNIAKRADNVPISKPVNVVNAAAFQPGK